jgi:hypothetical protein
MFEQKLTLEKWLRRRVANVPVRGENRLPVLDL